MKMPKISTGQAQVLIGVVGIGIGLYSLYQTKETVKNAAQATADAFNPTKDTNLASKGARAVLGDDFVIDKIGGGVANIVDFFSSKKETTKPSPVPDKKKTVLAPPIKSVKDTVGVLKPDPNAAKKKQQSIDGFWAGLTL